MANSWKAQVPLAAIVPGENPRREFGDLGALAAAIEATGGQPINPPVVVPDGSQYRLVDGERRVRALRKLHGDRGMADVLVFADLADAEQAVAMMATDEKQPLTEPEKARGFQLMLLLGVEERTIAKAVRRKVADVRKAKKVADKAPEQATLDQMICAAGFDDEADQAAVLEAAPDRWRARAETIRRTNESRAQAEAMRAAILDLGFDPEEAAPEGYRSIMWADTPEDLRRLAEAHDDEELAVWPTTWNKSAWYVGHKVDEPKETPEQREARELAERRRAATGGLRKALLMEAATSDIMPHMQAKVGELRSQGYNYARDDLRKRLLEMLSRRGDGDEYIRECSERQVEDIIASEASMYELLAFIDSPPNVFAWWRWVTELLPAAVDDDYVPSEEDLWLMGEAEAARDEAEAKAGGEPE